MIVFRFSRGVLIGCLSFIVILIVFFLYCYSLYLLKPSNSFVIGFTFFGTMLGINYILNIIFSKYVYIDMGMITYSDNEMIISYGQEQLSYNSKTINSIVFEYRGDFMWRARNPKFQKFKSKSRYRIKGLIHGYEKTTFDKIIINSREFYIKIKNLRDKENFYKLVDWAKSQGLKYQLIEDKYYMQFK